MNIMDAVKCSCNNNCQCLASDLSQTIIPSSPTTRQRPIPLLLSYWQKQLTGAPELLSLPTDYPRSKKQNFQSSYYKYKISMELVKKLYRIVDRYDIPLFITLLSVFKILLYRYSNQNDILVGTSSASQTLSEIKPSASPKINTLVLRTIIRDNMSFLELSNEVKQTSLLALEHQEVTFFELLEHLQINNDLPYHPIFQVLFELQNTETLLPDQCSIIPRETKSSLFPLDLFLSAREESDNLELCFTYSTDLFDPSTIARMAIHFEQIILSLTKYPSHPINTLPLLTKDEKKIILYDWNSTEKQWPHFLPIHRLIEQQVILNPIANAVIYKDTQLTYQTLNTKANQLAHYLLRQGIKINQCIAIFLERSLEMVIGLLGILKAGAAYIPIDPAYPIDRVCYMLEDSETTIILTQAKFKPLLNQTLISINMQNYQLIALDEDINQWIEESVHNPEIEINPDDLIYVIYTSGSTGKPKGVMNIHQGLTNRLLWMQDRYGLTSQDTVLQKTSFSFDVSVWEFFWPLMAGARLVVAEPEGHKDTLYLAKLIQLHQITTLHFVPSMLHLFLIAPEIHNCTSLRRVICSGEALSTELVKQFYQTFNAELHNLYGPTEASIDVTAWTCPADIQEFRVPIGKPIANTQLYILDNFLQPVPIGVAGELYIGGIGLARGYLNKQILTEQKFIQNPFQTEKDLLEGRNSRLYKTGDIARYLPDGNVEYLGRIDDQVKIRGFRIELGEIEAALLTHEKIVQAVIRVQEQNVIDKKLVAYIVLKEPLTSMGLISPNLSDEFKEYLGRSLPDYMVPTFFVYLDQMPITANGKLDYKALPAIDFTIRQSNEKYVAPRTHFEQELGEIWSDVLKVKEIGLYDNFFKLGGHSLLATQIVTRIRRQYHIDMPVRDLFENPTLAKLSTRLEHLMENGIKDRIPALIAMPKSELTSLSFAQQRLWFLDQLLPEIPLYHIPIAFQLRGALNLNALEQAFNNLIQRQESLRTCFPTQHGKAYQKVLNHILLDWKLICTDLSQLSTAEMSTTINHIMRQQASDPFILSTGPLFRVKLLVLSQNEFVLLVTFHHIIADGWSVGVFKQELSALYQAAFRSDSSSIPSLPIQYRDFTLWQRQWLSGDILERQLTYWQKQLANIPDLLSLPIDYPRPKELSYRGDIYCTEFSQELKSGLYVLAEQHQASLYMVLLAVFQVLLYRYTGQEDIVVGSPIANRREQTTESLIGFFVNTLSIRTQLNSQNSFIEILNQVKETTLQAYQHQDVPFEQLVDHLQVKRELNRNPVFQVMFTTQSIQEQEPLILQDMEVTALDTFNPVSKFDLCCTTYEQAHGIKVEIEYATDLFERETITRLAAHFNHLAQALVNDPTQAIYSYPLMTQAEQYQILEQWNNTNVSYAKGQTIHNLFEVQAIQSPTQLAIICDDRTLSYQELNEQANQLAHYLRRKGIVPEVCVGLAMDRSIEMVIALLAILKAGGTYVPLDLNYPIERLRFMLADTKAPVLVTLARIARDDLLAAFSGEIVKMDDALLTIQQEPCTNLVPLAAEHSAYVIYTSGSTGQPKGVLVPHSSVVNCVYAIKDMANIERHETFLALTSLSFDVSALDYYLPFATASTIVLCTDSDQKDGFKLVELIKKHDVSCIQGTPSLFRMMLETQQVWDKPVKIMLAGEALPADLVTILKRDNKIFNIYGPTEATVYSTFAIISDEARITIGRPIKNTRAYILDKNQNLVPLKVAGELYVGGINLAVGYLNRPELTAEKFVPNPFVTAEEAQQGKNLRLYRTGDLTRYLPDGSIEYLGRIDDQVKIRGFRIELGEIEAALNSHRDVSQAIVIVKEIEPGDKKLVAYLVPDEKQSAAFDTELMENAPLDHLFFLLQEKENSFFTQNLKNYLNSLLPSYMIPAFFVYINQIPLTPNKKINRNALQNLKLNLKSVTNNPVIPQNSLEQQLLNIWQEVLKVQVLGIHDNFFNIGGDSIISIQLVAKARNKGIYFTAKDLFIYPTIAALASIVKTEVKNYRIPPDQTTLSGEVPLAPIQQWFFNHKLAEIHHFNQAVLLLVNKRLDFSLLDQAFSLLLSHHDALRFKYFRDKKMNVWKQIYLPCHDSPVCTLFSLCYSTDSELLNNIKNHANLIQSSFNIEKGPLLKAVLFDCGQSRPMRLLIVSHHLVIDGVSWRILLEDLEKFYNQVSKNKTICSLYKTHSYRQWVETLQTYVNSPSLQNEISYWQHIEKSIRRLPTDFNLTSTLDAATSTVTASLSDEETTNLLYTAPSAYKTEINDLLLTALILCIGQWTGEYALTLSLEGHGREDINQEIDISRTVGWFTSIFPVYLKIDEPENIGKAIKSVKETLRAIPNRGFGYGVLKYMTDHLHSETLIVPSLNFNYLGQWDNSLTETGLFDFAKELEGEGLCISNKNRFPYYFDINCEVKNGSLYVHWTYSCYHYKKQTIVALCSNFIEKLNQIIQHCCQNNFFGYTASDFDLINLSSIENDLKNILEKL